MDIGEALRYLGAANPSEELRRQAAEIAGSIRETPRYTYRVFGVSRVPEGVSLEGCGVVLAGRMAETMLSECSQAALMACTLGAEFDRRLRAMQARDMSSAVILDACGSALVESGCDAVEAELAGRFPERFLTDRFSPGYGDLPGRSAGSLRGSGCLPAAWAVRHREPSAESDEVCHGCDRAFGQTPGCAYPGLRVLPPAGRLPIPKRRNLLWRGNVRNFSRINC